jgi:hypothetical protein
LWESAVQVKRAICAFLGIFLVSGWLCTPAVQAKPNRAAAITRKDLPPATKLKSYIEADARKSGVPPRLATWIVEHESQWNPHKIGDDGKSQGLWQFNRRWHPEISKRCAFSVSCSTHFAMRLLAAGKQEMWTTWKYRCERYSDAPDCR